MSKISVHEVYAPTSPIEARADIVFLHGLGGDRRETWMSNPSRDDSFWPKWLAEDVEYCRVLTVEYPARALHLNRGMSLDQYGRAIIDALSADSVGKRQIVFVSHSMGGLVVKQILKTAHDSGADMYSSIIDQTCCVIFFATPHEGSEFANLAKLLLGSLSTKETRQLEKESKELLELSTWYRNWSKQFSINTIAYSESLPTVFGKQIVPETSADPKIPGCMPISVAANHSDICKPVDRRDTVFKSVRAHVLRLLNFSGEDEDQRRDFDLNQVGISRLLSPEVAVIFLRSSLAGGQETTTLTNWPVSLSSRLPHIDVFEYLIADSFENYRSQRPGLSLTHYLQICSDRFVEAVGARAQRQRKLVFVAHSLNSIVLKRAVQNAIQGPLQSPLASRIGGIIFLSPLHNHYFLRSYVEYNVDHFGRAIVDQIGSNLLQVIEDVDREISPELKKRSVPITNLYESDALAGADLNAILQSQNVQSLPASNALVEKYDHCSIGFPFGPTDPQWYRLEMLVQQIEQGAAPSNSIFLHFLDHHFLSWHGFDQSQAVRVKLLREIELAIRIALSLFDKLLVPASSIFHHYEIGKVIYKYHNHFPDKFLLFGEGWSIEDYADTAKNRYREGDAERQLYAIKEWHRQLNYYGRQRSATQEVINRWLEFGPEPFLVSLGQNREFIVQAELERRWHSIPTQIQGLAFMADYILPEMVGETEMHKNLERPLRRLTGDYFFDSVAKEFNSMVFSGLRDLARPPGFVPGPGFMDLPRAVERVQASEQLSGFLSLDTADFASLINSKSASEALDELFVALSG